MRVDNGPAVWPKRGHGQVIEHGDALSVPLSTLYVSVSPAGGGGSSGCLPASGTLIARDGLAACSALAALCLCQVWLCFLATGTAGLFFYQGASSAMQFAALLADTLLLTGLFVALAWLGNQMRRFRAGRFRAGEMLGDAAFLLFLAVPANAIRGLFQVETPRLTLEYWRHVSAGGFSPVLEYLGVGGALGLLATIFFFHRQLVRMVSRTLVILFPLVPFMLAEATWVVVSRAVTHPASGASRAGSFAPEGRPGGSPSGVRPQRVVWIIFDEMDYRLAFETATNAQLPEFNRLGSQSLYAVRAYPPGGRTMISVPALLSGHLVTSSNPAGPSELRVQYEGVTAPVRWKAEQTIFDLEHEKGWRTGIVGWHFPYSRIFSGGIEAWERQSRRLALNPNRPFIGLMTDEFRVLAEGKSRSLLGKSLSVMEHQQVVRETVAEAIRKAANPALDLVFLHLPVPHAPFFYDAKTGQDAARPRPVVGYLDHLQLGDRVLGQIRQAMKDAGVEEKTALLVSSDHWYRESDLIDGKMDHRVPFLVSFPGGAQSVRYSRPFNTILSRRLVTAIMNGEIRSAGETARWIDREKGGLQESPYNRK